MRIAKGSAKRVERGTTWHASLTSSAGALVSDLNAQSEDGNRIPANVLCTLPAVDSAIKKPNATNDH